MADRLHVEVDGGPGRPPLLAIHGFLSSNLQWAPNRDRLRESLRLVAVELWGHGKSPTPRAAGAYRVGHYLAEFERIRSELGVARWAVCGQSFGAGIAIRYALTHPESVAGLVVTNSRSALNVATPDATAGGGLAAWEAMDARSLPYHPCHARRFPAELKARMERAADAVPAYALWQATATTVPDLSCRHLASGIRVPTLLVNGRYERRFQPDRDFAAAAIPDIEIVDLDAGHSVNVEAPVPFERAVVEFVTRQR